MLQRRPSELPNLLLAPKACLACPIRERAVCALCGPQELSDLDKIKSYRRFAPGEEIVATGEDSGFVGSVVEGHVSLKRSLPDGRRQMVGLLFPSDFLGRPKRALAPYDAEAVDDVLLCTFDRRRFDALMVVSPVIEERLLEMTLDELDAARNWLLLLGRKTARERIASFLLLVAGRTTVQRRGEIELPVSREDMAEYLGLTIETVSRQMTALRKNGVIDLPSARRIRILDAEGLRLATGDIED